MYLKKLITLLFLLLQVARVNCTNCTTGGKEGEAPGASPSLRSSSTQKKQKPQASLKLKPLNVKPLKRNSLRRYFKKTWFHILLHHLSSVILRICLPFIMIASIYFFLINLIVHVKSLVFMLLSIGIMCYFLIEFKEHAFVKMVKKWLSPFLVSPFFKTFKAATYYVKINLPFYIGMLSSSYSYHKGQVA